LTHETVGVNVRYQADKTVRVPLSYGVLPLYRFAVHSSHRYDVPEGTELPDDEAAREEALQVIRDLKKNNETGWKGCTITVADGDRQVWRIPFIEAE
jgi:hypothetical protein